MCSRRNVALEVVDVMFVVFGIDHVAVFVLICQRNLVLGHRTGSIILE